MSGMPRIVVALTLTLALTAAGCSNAPPSATGDPAPSSSVSPSAASSESSAPSASPSASIATLPPSSPSSNPNQTARPPGSGSIFPTPGEYVYAQSGTETLCSATACGTPRPLPDRMYATVAHAGRAGGADSLGLEFRIAQGRTVRVDARYTSSAAMLQRFRAEFTEAGITQTETIEPQPALALLKFPLSQGARWSGEFTDGESSGRYAFRVIARETIKAGGRQVRAWKIDGSIEASGDGDASIQLTTWIDPESRAFMRLSGSIDATYELARYKASFTQTLISAPANR